tara:strand:+ start:751 stop:996 length:246 start_codon:yes stop_codon:yes gene_type:complete
MPLYSFRNKDTGEVMEKQMAISSYDQWVADNPVWERYHTGAPLMSTDGGRDMLSRVPDGFRDHLKRIKKGSGRVNTIRTKS